MKGEFVTLNATLTIAAILIFLVFATSAAATIKDNRMRKAARNPAVQQQEKDAKTPSDRCFQPSVKTKDIERSDSCQPPSLR